jgi:hypothetical protein
MDALPPIPVVQAPAVECVRWSWSSDRIAVWCLKWREKGKPEPKKVAESD